MILVIFERQLRRALATFTDYQNDDGSRTDLLVNEVISQHKTPDAAKGQVGCVLTHHGKLRERCQKLFKVVQQTLAC